MKILKQRLAQFTWNDLREFAGSKIVKRGKSYARRVSGLSILNDSRLVAWVDGSRRYATTVEVDKHGELDWFCTCPYDWGGPCKHVIAVILAAIDKIRENKTISPLDPDERDLYQVVTGQTGAFMDDGGDRVDQEIQCAKPLKDILQGLSRRELIDLILEMSRRFPEISMRITQSEQLKQGDVRQIVRSLRQEIIEVTNQEAWYNPWRDEGSLPDYSPIREQLEMLHEARHYHAVLQLGDLLWKKGNEQVASSHDEGETAIALGECMDIVFHAILHSSLAREEQLFRLIRFSIEDEYAIAEGCSEIIEDPSFTPEDWKNASEMLEQQLKETRCPSRENYSLKYRREQLVDWLIRAWEQSSQREKVIPLLEKEVPRIHCYVRLVDALLAENRKREARRWCIRGIRKTRNSLAGIASALQKKLRTLADLDDRPDMVAAYRAEDFFLRPALRTYLALQKATKALGNWLLIRTMVMEFLENGTRPDMASKKKWPLPTPEARTEKPSVRGDRFPRYGTLIDIAIHEKRFDDVVRLHKSRQETSRRGGDRDREVAEAVAETHPDVSLAIWEKLARSQIGLVKPTAYEVAGTYLSKMRSLYQKTNRLDQWHGLIESIRREHARKRRLLEVLDALENKKILTGP